MITESQYRFLVENTTEINQILDKMNEIGYENLDYKDKMTLNDYSEWLKGGKKSDFPPKKGLKTVILRVKWGINGPVYWPMVVNLPSNLTTAT